MLQYSPLILARLMMAKTREREQEKSRGDGCGPKVKDSLRTIELCKMASNEAESRFKFMVREEWKPRHE